MADKTEVINVTEYAGASDRNGNDCWKLKAVVGWSNYPIEYMEWPRPKGESAFQLGQYRVEFNKGKSFGGKQGSDRDYDYYWNPITMTFLGAAENEGSSSNGEQPANNNFQPNRNSGGGGSATSDTKKDRSMAISYAKDLCCADKIERGEMYAVATGILQFIEGGPDAVQEDVDEEG
jgi:hypothetical protein